MDAALAAATAASFSAAVAASRRRLRRFETGGLGAAGQLGVVRRREGILLAGRLQGHRQHAETTLTDVGIDGLAPQHLVSGGRLGPGGLEVAGGIGRRYPGRVPGLLGGGDGVHRLLDRGVEAGQLEVGGLLGLARHIQLGEQIDLVGRDLGILTAVPAELLVDGLRLLDGIGNPDLPRCGGSRDREESERSQARPDPAWHGEEGTPPRLPAVKGALSPPCSALPPNGAPPKIAQAEHLTRAQGVQARRLRELGTRVAGGGWAPAAP